MPRKSTRIHQPFKQIADLLKNKKYKCRQLLDGMIYVYNKEYLMCSFRWCGTLHISELILNTKQAIGLKSPDKMRFYTEKRPHGEELHLLLQKLFPNAGNCDARFKNAYPFSVIEWLIKDANTQIEVYPSPQKIIYKVYLINAKINSTSSFRYLPQSNRIDRIYVKYSYKAKAVRIPEIKIPETHTKFFKEFIDKHST